MTRSNCSTSRATSLRIVSAVFFLGGRRGLFHWAQTTDLPIDADQIVGQALEFTVLGDLALGFTDGSRGWKALRDRLAFNLLGELGIRPVSRVIGFGAMARGFPTPERRV
jgi:hypothetical protein